jgi:hypothetical protein
MISLLAFFVLFISRAKSVAISPSMHTTLAAVLDAIGCFDADAPCLLRNFSLVSFDCPVSDWAPVICDERYADLVSVRLTQQHQSGQVLSIDLNNTLLPQLALTGTLTSMAGLLTTLTSLNIASNVVSGTLPTQLGKLRDLAHLDLSFNVLTGVMPTQMGAFGASLTYLDLSTNAFVGTVPCEFGELRILRRLNLAFNLMCPFDDCLSHPHAVSAFFGSLPTQRTCTGFALLTHVFVSE